MEKLIITARRWSGGWELWHEDEVWTQVRTLPKARQQVIDYLDTIEEDIDHSNYDITIIPEIAHQDQVEKSMRAAREAELSAQIASTQSRAAVQALKDENLSLADIGFIMGLSRARVSQLAKA
ncbi:hypothetical protein [Trueperella pyogenes]|uniref:hypothetical protein n=1 Tax=Trueperella pyogenes TaxID=1661 RepID=UPI00043B0C49|nr:hypothetical protein [Trueperella pyogenes]AHU89933.1 antitoxin HicB [Trueperella pyogenes]AWA43964.1 antitoxin HicB [Trueperella pyogenes]OQD35516.1 hypothetical protein B1R42_08465 [Trueperella pyogenes]